jgi:tRNA-dihydrouridine synthase
MIGKGVFSDPFVFSSKSPWDNYSISKRLKLFKKHVKLFSKTWPGGEARIAQLNKFCKVYINGFDGAKELREQLMRCHSFKELLDLINSADKNHGS